VTTDSSGNMTTATAGQIAVAAPVVTLSATVAAPVPSTISPGRAASLSIVITNTGNIATVGKLSVVITILQSDHTTPAQPALTIPLNRRILASGKLPLRFGVKTLASLAAGSYLLSVQITDGAGNTTGQVIGEIGLVVA
jgi:hypothetical protein